MGDLTPRTPAERFAEELRRPLTAGQESRRELRRRLAELSDEQADALVERLRANATVEAEELLRLRRDVPEP